MNKQGLTLMEVIVSALILSITVGGVLYIFSTEKGVVARTGRQMQTMDFARQTMEELKNAVDADTYDTGDLTAGGPHDMPLSAGDFRDKFSGTRSYTVQDIHYDADGEADCKKVEVVVDWSEPAESQ